MTNSNPPKYQKIIDNIRAGKHSRAGLNNMETNACRALKKKGDQEAQLVLDAILQAKPRDQYYLFMGFCPNADLANRLDIEWKAQGICTYAPDETWLTPATEKQAELFADIRVGDMVILKKRQKIGESMRLYGHGRVTGRRYDANGYPELVMHWSDQNELVEVPLMGCNATVNVVSADKVQREMPEEFFQWLECDAALNKV
jgi:hypothetical protein